MVELNSKYKEENRKSTKKNKNLHIFNLYFVFIVYPQQQTDYRQKKLPQMKDIHGNTEYHYLNSHIYFFIFAEHHLLPSPIYHIYSYCLT